MGILEKTKELGTSPLFFVLVGVLVGYIFFTTIITTPKVGIIEINGVIRGKETVEEPPNEEEPQGGDKGPVEKAETPPIDNKASSRHL